MLANARGRNPPAEASRESRQSSLDTLAFACGVRSLCVAVDRHAHRIEQCLILDRLAEIFESSVLHGMDPGHGIATRGEENHVCCNPAMTELRLQLSARHAGHLHIQHKALRRGELGARECSHAGFECDDSP